MSFCAPSGLPDIEACSRLASPILFPLRNRFFMKPFRFLAGITSGMLLLFGPVMADEGIIETVIAPASKQSPRNSEGDIVLLKDGSLLAAWTEFTGGARDDSAARISAKRSRDGGRTWGKRYTLRENTGRQNVMSVSFLRLNNGELLLFYLEKHSTSDLDCLVVRSNDEGQTWSDPVLITRDDGYFVMNNARVVQLSSGRIVAPCSYTPEVWKKGNVFKTVCFFSDDGGRTWARGQGECECPRRGAMEPGLIEKKDGTVLQYIRTQTGRQWFAESSDGCNTWSKAKPWTVISPEAPATVAPLPNNQGWLLVHNPTVDPKQGHGGARTPLVAAISHDEGQTWSAPKEIESNRDDTYAYVSIDVHNQRALLTYYVFHGKNDPQRAGWLSWKFQSIPLDWFPRPAGWLAPEVRAQCLGVLREGMRSDEFWPSIHAAEALTLAGQHDEVRTFLTPKLKTEEDLRQRCGVARELVRAGEIEQSRVMLQILLRKDESYAHTHAAESLFKVGWKGDSAPLKQAMNEGEEPPLRLMAAAALAKYETGDLHDQALALIRRTIRETEDLSVLRIAVWILGRIGEESDRALIRSRWEESRADPLARAYLDHALARLGDKQGRAALLRNLESRDPAIRTYAAVFAGESGMFEAVPLLIRQLKDESLDARVRAAQALIVLDRLGKNKES